MTDKIDPMLYNLDGLLQDIYDFVYQNSDDYEIEFFDANDLKLDRFKLSDYDVDSLFTKGKIVHAGLFPIGLKYNDEPVKEIRLKRVTDKMLMHNIRIVPYKSPESLNNINDPVNVNLIMRTLLSEFVVSKRTDAILLPIINFDVKGSDIMDYDIVKELIDPNKFYSIQITEKFYKMVTLKKYLENYLAEPDILKSIIFQILRGMNVFLKNYPHMRFGHIDPEYIDCYITPLNNTFYPKLKFSQFYLSSIKDIIKNDYVDSNNLTIVDNPYADLFDILSYLWSNYKIDIEKSSELVDFFNIALPDKIRGHEGRLTQKQWDNLSDDEKDNLLIKNLVEHNIFTSRDSLSNIKSIESRNINDDSSENKHNEMSNVPSVSVDEITLDQNSDSDETIADTEILTDKDITDLNDDDIPIVRVDSDEDIFTTDRDSEFNIKSNNNDIDNMSKNKKSKKSTHETTTESEYTEDHVVDEPARPIVVSDSHKASGKVQRYRGRRQVMGMTSHKKVNPKVIDELGLSQFARHTNGYDQHGQNAQQMPDDNMFMRNGVPSKINSIGSALGANPADYNMQSRVGMNNFNQMQQMPQMPQMQQVPQMQHMPQQPQMPDQSQMDDGMMRYLNAANQSNQMTPEMAQQMAQLQQMQQMAQLQQMQQMQQMQQPMQPQMGGGRNGNFFFQR